MSFVQQRERRANAGSRMRALLDKELDMEELFELEESEDESFSEIEQDEPQDTVDSDFDLEESEGEEEQEKLAEAEEKNIRKEEKKTKKPNTKPPSFLHKAKITKSSSASNNNNNKIPIPTSQRNKKNEIASPSFGSGGRQSFRTKTVLNRILVEEQIRENELRKALIPKRLRPLKKQFTQEELLAEAAKTEEENRASLLQWQQKEAERQEKSKIQVKRGIEGPFIRYHSFTDGTINDRPKQKKLIMLTDDDDDDGGGGDGDEKDMNEDHENKVKQIEITDPMALDHQYQLNVLESNIESRNLITFFSPSFENKDDPIHQQQQLQISSNTNHINNNENNENHTKDNDNNNDLHKEIPRNKLKHININGLTDREIDKLDIIPALASWIEKAPRAIKPIPCPITGKEARYCDPITTTPYATKEAYTIIQDCLQHKYIWSPSLGIYVGNEQDPNGALGVLDGWDRMIKGKKEGSDDWVPPYPSWLTHSKESSPSQELVDDQSSSLSASDTPIITSYENNENIKTSKKRQRRAIS
ncbi:YL1 nuclear protein-domain-containing protein [Cunninghamella echinulata]|nr:YL1 nuclear protein-domain-containing protein [Cunninghamella echinulata]